MSDEADNVDTSSNAASAGNSSQTRSEPRLRAQNIFPTQDYSDFSDDDWFQGFGGQDDEDLGMDRFAEVIVFLDSGDFINTDLSPGLSHSTVSRRDSPSFYDDGELPDDPHEREVLGSLPEPTMSLHAAAMRGNAKELRRWQIWKGLGGGHAIWKHCGDLPLHCAARAGDVSTVEELLKEGASVTQTNHWEHTALEIAARNDHAAVVMTLLEHGAGLDYDGVTRAFCATKSWAVVKVLADYENSATDDSSASATSSEKSDGAPWLYQMLFRVVQKGCVTMLRGLLRMGANANSTGILLGSTPLQIACRRGHIRCVSELLQHGADVTARDDFKWTALHYAAREGHCDIVQMLLKAGADVTAMCRTGRTPIDVAHDDATRQILENHRHWQSV